MSLLLFACGETGAVTPDAGSPEAGVEAGVPEGGASDASTDASDGGTEAASDAGHDAGDATAAYVPTLPQVENPYGGPVLQHPRLVPIVFAGDSLAPTIEDFVGKLAASSYFVAATKEYGVGAPTSLPAVVVPGAPPATVQSADIVTWVTSQSSGVAADAGGDAGAPWPAEDGNTVYMIFYPDGTTIEQAGQGGGVSKSCTDFGGYHDEAPAGASGSSAPFAVIARCSNYLGLGGTDFVTFAASHEAIEASTDPFVNSFPAYGDVSFAGSGWSTAAGGPEVGDLCKLETSSQIRPADIGYMVQRGWSNAAAKGAHDPCAPAPASDPYFVAVPDLAGTEVYPGYYVDGVVVPPGGKATVDVHLYADTPSVGTWDVSVTEPTLPQLPDPAHQLTLSLDKTSGQSGDVVHLTIQRAAAAQGQPSFGAPFQITSKQGSVSHSYWGVVGN